MALLWRSTAIHLDGRHSPLAVMQESDGQRFTVAATEVGSRFAKYDNAFWHTD
jgi:hypothetical protein